MYEQHTPLTGRLHVLPFDGRSLPHRIRPIYDQLLDDIDRDPRDVLILKRLPDGIPEFTAALRESLSLQARPNVKSIARHASTVVDESEPGVSRLTYEQRIEFLAAVLEGYDWGDYFDHASAHDSFGSDVGQLLLDATWQGGFDLPNGLDEYDQLIGELAAVNDSFHEKLETRDLVEQADIVPRAVTALDDTELHDRISREFDVVLAVEFEEYSAIEREYLAKLTASVPLVCVGEIDASIDRVKKEAGDVRSVADELSVIDHTASDEADGVSIPPLATDMAGSAFAEYLAKGEISHKPETPARVITGETLEREVREVANEIEHLRQEHGWNYADFNVLLRSVGDPMPKVRRILRTAGIPTASVGVSGLEQDLAVRELHAFAQYHIDGDENAFALLRARLPDIDDEFIQDCVERGSIANSLKRWIVSTDLKRRIATNSTDLDAREQFSNVSRLLTIAEFVDEQDFLSGDWFEFGTMLERAITYDAPYAHTADVTVPDGGVTVGDVALVKDGSSKVVFLMNVVDSEYPGSESLSPLFPTAWIKRMDEYPAVTAPTVDAVTTTFTPAETVPGNEFERYHAERTRRQLAVGARAAEEYLYFCTYDVTDSSIGSPQQKSRYLHAIEEHPRLPIEVVSGPGEDRDYHTLGSASAKILAEPWSSLEEVQAIASQGGDVELKSIVTKWATIQDTIEESDSVSEQFVRAVRTQFDLARGAVRPGDESPREEAE